jgi:hypothetical protein
MMVHDALIILFLVAFGASSIYAFLKKMADVGLLAVFQSWRERPLRAITVGVEFALVIGAAAGYTYTARWAAVVWYIAGLFFAGMMLLTIKLGSKSDHRSITALSAEVKNRRPWPPPQPDPASDTTSTTAVAENLDASPSTRRSAKTDYRAVLQWRTPVPEDIALRKLAYQHGIAYRDNMPEPLALCGHQYDPLDLPPDRAVQLWGIGVPKSMRCPKCTQALRDAGYSLWNIDANALGR